MAEPGPALESVRLHVAGMDCADEVAALRRLLQDQPGIRELSFSLMQGTMTVRHEPSVIGAGRIVALVAGTGMKASVADGRGAVGQRRTVRQRGPLQMAVIAGVGTALGLALSYVQLPTIHHTSWPSAIAYSLAIAAAWRYAGPKAWKAAGALRLDMNVLMTIAVAGAIGLGEWFEASTVAFLFAVSNLLETWSVSRARQAIRSLMELTPNQARVLRADRTEQQVDTEAVRMGDRVVVKPGEKFPLDGRVTEGATTVNQAPITGESVPVGKDVGDEVLAGTINQDGAVVVEVTTPAEDTVLAGVVRLVEQAQAQRSPSERFVDRFARYYTPAVIVGAVVLCTFAPLALGAAWETWFYRSLVLLVIACPCALVISTPVTVVSGLAAAARNGVLIKGGAFLESVGRASVVALDKTGTLTVGRPQVEKVIPINANDEDELLGIAAAIEQRSEHMIATAIVAHARRRGISPPACESYQAISGKGARATVAGERYLIGNHRLLEEHDLCTGEVHRVMGAHADCRHTTVALSSAEQPLGVFLLADSLRPEAAPAIEAFREAGVEKVVMLTGDNAGTAQAIARECGDIEFAAELLPADKVETIERLKAGRSHVVMVGDGINDAPALAAADVGIAMGTGGTDTALETADIGLMTDDLSKLPWLIRHSRRTRAIIVQNVVLSIAIKAIFVALAVPGLANLWMAIAADMGASLLVTFNGLRLLRTGDSRGVRAKLTG